MTRSAEESVPARPGTGARCPQAQADGVPCPELRDCEICRPALRLERTFIDGAYELAPIVPRCAHA